MSDNKESKMILPTMYKIRDTLISNGHMQDRVEFIRNLGVPADAARALGVQDRASSLMAQLSHLVEQSGNDELINKANNIITKWNNECDAVFSLGSNTNSRKNRM